MPKVMELPLRERDPELWHDRYRKALLYDRVWIEQTLTRTANAGTVLALGDSDAKDLALLDLLKVVNEINQAVRDAEAYADAR